jgi:hypothetical protein
MKPMSEKDLKRYPLNGWGIPDINLGKSLATIMLWHLRIENDEK